MVQGAQMNDDPADQGLKGGSQKVKTRSWPILGETRKARAGARLYRSCHH